VQSHAAQNRDLGASVVTVNIFGGIRFRKTELLGFRKSFGERNSCALNALKNLIAGSVENPAQLNQFVSGQTFL